MSRIEEALKKVASQRKKSSGSAIEQKEQKKTRYAQPKSIADLANSLLEVVPIKVKNIMLGTAREEKTIMVEEFNKLRSTVIALTKGEKFLNTLMVTSTVKEEGKSITALNLAISLAKEHDHTVLLVDADLRRPSVHKYLDIEPEYGLVHCLRDDLPLEKALVKTGVGKLVILPAGESVEDPLDMLSSNKMKKLIQELKERYPERYVIFDTPPALFFADASVIANFVDSTLFVVRERKADKGDLRKVLASFKDKNLLGIVYNDAQTFMKKQDQYYY